MSRGQKGEQLADIAELKQAGCVAITDDGHPVATALLMRRALEYAGMFDMPVIEHCEEQTLKGDGVAHEGFHASALGLRGIPGEAESIMALRDISLAELTGGAVHIAHMSARQTLDAVRYGKARGVTRHLRGDAASLRADRRDARRRRLPYDTNVKMNPPLREAADRDAMLAGARRRQRRRHRHRPRAASLRREAGRVRSRAVRHHRPRDGGVAVLRSARARRRRLAAAADRAAVGEPGADPARPRRLAVARARRPTSRILAPDLPVTIDAATHAVEVEEHAVRRLDAARRRRRDDRRRPRGLRERTRRSVEV